MEEGFGFIHEKLDIKILILYVLARLPGPVDRDGLADVVFCDGGVDYFSYAECLSELSATGHIEEDGDRFSITEIGREDGSVMEGSLPVSVRARADMAMLPVAARISRDSLIHTSHEVTEQGCMVQLSMSDGQGEVLSMRLLAADERQARTMENTFRVQAEAFYVQLIEMLSGT